MLTKFKTFFTTTILSITILLFSNIAYGVKLPEMHSPDTLFNKGTVLKTMERVADWQLEHWATKEFKHKKWHWANATGYTGSFELGKISNKESYLKTLLDIGPDLNWNTEPRKFFADDYCIGQTYALLHMKYKEPKMIARFRLLADKFQKPCIRKFVLPVL